MKLSRDRILTTHVGSLPRSGALTGVLLKKERGEAYETGELDRVVREAVLEIVARQVATGIDVVSDGEAGKIGYATYIKDRLAGFGGESTARPHLDLKDHPELRKRMIAFTGPQTFKRLCCVAPVRLEDREAVHKDIANFRAALERTPATDAFLNAASPGVVSSFQPNRYYASHEAYVEAVGEVMREEYEAIVAGGFVLQVDCPDLAMSRHTGFQELTEEQFLHRAAHHVEVLNEALRNIPAVCVRMHVCWGNYEGPHDHDIALEKVLGIILKAKPQGISFEASNPRHAHEWAVWREAELPDEKVLIPGVLDSSTNFVEHPELIAQRIGTFAAIVGRERVLAGSDCGFGTFAGYGKVDPGVAFKKLRSLVEGARIASARLWRK
ncbi:MAG TPA: cobalamin-independent methionine synthase II family protein [Steroidobacteraceae bacterium]|nr:cobalamin-independent methionine synthase II family protein [Steroidobacteraceae bacterium]